MDTALFSNEMVRKLPILADAAKYDASCASSGSRRARAEGGIGTTEGMGICHSYTPDGRCVSLLKILLTNYCIYDCHYCINRISSDTPRARFSVAEVVGLTLEFYKRNYIEGLFLSSGVAQNPDATMEQLYEVARQLRHDHRFGGYIHLKAIPGASAEILAKAASVADRLSANIELPTQKDLDGLAPAKSHQEIENSMARIRTASQTDDKKVRPLPGGQSTQMIVGATATSDSQILSKATQLYSTYRLRRVYYSAFSPMARPDPLLPLVATPLVREHRLYQADWLMRFYGFRADELTTEAAMGNLDLQIDPKLAWALRHRDQFPLDINVAPREALLRIPGIGLRNVERLLQIRRYHALTLEDLGRLRMSLRKIQPFVITAGRAAGPRLIDKLDLRIRVQRPEQLELLTTAQSALSGQV